MSSAGKSLLVAGLCRIFRQDGYRVSPFKSQNMALNSFITEDGLEMGRAQVMQAEAAGISPSVYMNPILLKPTDHYGSQVIVNGKVLANMPAREYFNYKKNLLPDILHAIDRLKETSDIIVIEGAGSPAEINLKQHDIVNMGMAKLVDAPVLLVGDIDRGGVFAQLYGTVQLLEEDERARIKGLIINKFRGDKTILDPGIEMLEERCHIPVTGVVPYMDLHVDDEDSLTPRFLQRTKGHIRLAVVHLPHISNFTDFAAFDQIPEFQVEYVDRPAEIDSADLVILPGSKNTMADMEWLRETGMDTAIVSYAKENRPVLGICGGYQMLGDVISDPTGVEQKGEVRGLGLLPVTTVLTGQKRRCQIRGRFLVDRGDLQELHSIEYEGYEIHMGQTTPLENLPFFTENESGYYKDNVYGTYIHGLFDRGDVLKALACILAKRKGISLDLTSVIDQMEWKNKEYDRLAATLRQYLQMDAIYQMMGIEPDENRTDQTNAN
jgi:adenosylcobyric acid synthase